MLEVDSTERTETQTKLLSPFSSRLLQLSILSSLDLGTWEGEIKEASEDGTEALSALQSRKF